MEVIDTDAQSTWNSLMKVTTLRLGIKIVKNVGDYSSVQPSAEVECQLEEGETIAQAGRALRKELERELSRTLEKFLSLFKEDE